MGKKIWKILMWVGIAFFSLVILSFLLSRLGVAGGIILFAIAISIIYYLISSGKIPFQLPQKKGSKKKKRRGRRSLPVLAGLGGFADFMKSGARIVEKGEDLPTFDDVAGLEEQKALLQESVDILKNRKKYIKIGARVPKGVLLVGPPGCGKTLLARATAGEANAAFISINGSEFIEVFVGVGAARVRDLFNIARRLACDKRYGEGAILFIDEIDAIGKTRVGIISDGGDERQQTLNQIFVEIDGFDKDDNIVVMAATNRPDVLDPALVRSGRFDRKIVIDPPDKDGRRDILKIHTREKKLAAENVADRDKLLDEVARATPGFSGADLENLANEAALLAARHNKKRIEKEDFLRAVDMVTIGPQRKSRKISQPEREITAYHEAGHALVAHFLSSEVEPPQKISIIPAGLGLGHTRFLPEQDRYLYTRAYLFARVKVYLGGRVAEEVIFGKEKISTGAADDLKEASKLVLSIICDYGMSDLGPGVFGKKEESLFLRGETHREKTYSEEKAKKIDEEFEKILAEHYREVKRLLTENQSKLDALAQALLLEDELERERILEIIKEEERSLN